jgi:hypothetical protein
MPIHITDVKRKNRQFDLRKSVMTILNPAHIVREARFSATPTIVSLMKRLFPFVTHEKDLHPAGPTVAK